jgi:hypothetical protein
MTADTIADMTADTTADMTAPKLETHVQSKMIRAPHKRRQ